MHEQLRQFLKAQWPDAEHVAVEDFAIIAGGYSEETFRFDCRVRRGGGEEVIPMILRKDPPPAVNILPTSREQEHRLLQRVREHTRIPVSRSYFVAQERHTFGEPAMLIERMPGSGQVSELFHGGPCAHMAESVATDLCELIAELHLADHRALNADGALDDPRGAGIDTSSWDRYMETTFDYYINGYEAGAFVPLPNVMDVYLEMRRRKPRPLHLTVVHGDFNPSNFLYKDGKVTALIDWENTHIGDPREDLGWMKQMDLLSNTDIMGSVKVDGGFIGHYNRITGFDVTEEEVEYFRLFGTANIAIPVLSAVKRRCDKEAMELLTLYIIQPALVSTIAWAQMLGYPMPTGGN